MSRLTDLIRQPRQKDPALADDLEREVAVLANRRAFGLNFERHTPEAVELPGRHVRRGDKVRVLPLRGTAPKKGDERLWRVRSIENGVDDRRVATLESIPDGNESETVAVADLVVVAEFRDPIYPGLVSMGKVERGGDKPFHAVINAENYHALQTLLFTHQGKVDCIYIDPPYNTGASDWKYNNDYVERDDMYRHSKWLAFMERRLELAKELLAPTGAIVVTIDEHEVHRLGILLSQIFPEHQRQMVTVVNNPKGVTQGYLSRVEEYAIFCFGPECKLFSVDDDLLTHREATTAADGLQRPRWKGLLRSGDEAARTDRESMFYPVWLDPNQRRLIRAGEPLPLGSDPDPDLRDGKLVPAWPIRKDGSQGRWGIGASTLNNLIERGFAACGAFDIKRRTWGISYLSQQVRADLEAGQLTIVARDETTDVADVAYVDAASRRVRTVWHRSSHDAGAHGTDLIGSLLGAGRAFPFPKSLYAVEDTLRLLLRGKTDATVVDFFAGSGTTAQATMRLNRQDGGSRQCILISNNEVSAIEQSSLRANGQRPGDDLWERRGIWELITKPRIQAAVTGRTPKGDKVSGAYRFTDEFPMSAGLDENVEFFTLTYEAPLRVASHREFQRIAPLLWLRAGSRGRRIDDLSGGWDVAEAYGVLADLDHVDAFVHALSFQREATLAFVVTDEDRHFESVVREMPEHVEPVRLYEAYLRNFEIETGRGFR